MVEKVLLGRKVSSLPVLTLFSLGFIFSFLSLRYESLILGLIGVGSIFYGAIVYLVGYRGFIRRDLLYPLIENSFTHYQRLFLAEGCRGRGIYMFLKGSKPFTRVFIPLSEVETHVPPQGVIDEGSFRVHVPRGLVFEPPGYMLKEFFEKCLNIKFEGLEVHEALNMVSEGLNRFEVSRGLNYIFEGGRVRVRFTGLLDGKFCRTIKRRYSGLCEQVGCPFCSLVACVLCESTGEPVFIESTIVSPEGGVVEAVFRFLR